MYRKVISVLAVIAALWCVVGAAPRIAAYAFAEAQQPQPADVKAKPSQPAQQTQSQPRVVDYEADSIIPIRITSDSMALGLNGHVVFYHNGAVITCDSAVHYNNKRIECFHNVVINQKETFVYGDRADYNGDKNIARVYAPIIKIVDKDATMYTYNFSYNTLDKVGEFHGTATISQKDNLLESNRGYYYTDERLMVCVGNAQLRNDEYRLKGDSIAYNMDTEVASFYSRSHIWNKNGELLVADRGSYDRTNTTYHFISNAYGLTEKQEMWCDTLDYNGETEDAVLRSNIQIRDEDNKAIAFGDYGLYWGQREEAMMTKRPSLVSYDPKEDTLYMRSDSMFLYTVSRYASEEIQALADSSARVAIEADSAAMAFISNAENKLAASKQADSTQVDIGEDHSDHEGHDHGDHVFEPQAQSPVTQDIVAGQSPQVSIEPPRAELEHVEVQTVLSDTLPAPRSQEAIMEAMDTGGAAISKAEQRRLEKEQKRLEKMAKDEARAKERATRTAGKVSVSQTVSAQPDKADSIAVISAAKADSAAMRNRADSTLAAHGARVDSLLTEGKTEQQDSMVRIVRAYRNVKIYRSDFQAVCDSLVAFSIDSTAHLYINPVMWNGDNQIKSDVMDIFSKNQQVQRAVFTGNPIMISQVDQFRYNQIKGKTIEALFRDNDIYRTNVDGNGQTLYYLTEQDSTGRVYMTGFMTIESAAITFYIKNKEMERMVWKGNPVYEVLKADDIPADKRFLAGFSWEAKRKPTLGQVFDRTIRATERERHEKLPQPEFPITARIMKRIDEMIKSGEWRDRNDPVSDQAQEFIRSLGY